MRLFALVTHVPAVHPGDLFAMKFALEQAAKDCADAWGLEPPAIEVMENEQQLPDGCCPVAVVDDSTDLSALAYHYWDDVRLLPAARAFWTVSSGLRTGSESLCEAISHEIHEALVDPKCDQWRDMPGRPGVEVALEICDPLQTSYDVVINGVAWPCASFVLPDWFREGGGKVGPDGYLILRNDTHVWYEGPDGQPFSAKKPGAAHPWARTVRRVDGRILRAA